MKHTLLGIIIGAALVIAIIIGLSSIPNASQVFASINTNMVTANPEVIFSFLAMMLAFLTLWFTSLKGPDIEILGKSNISYTVADDYIFRVPNSIKFQDLELIFTNHGSRTGTITKVLPKLEPETWFTKFYDAVETKILANTRNGNDMSTAVLQSVSILPGSNEVVRLSCEISTTNWKDYPRKLDPELQLGDTMRKALNVNYLAFEEFVKALNDSKSIGRLCITITITARKWWYKTVLKEQTLDFTIPLLPDQWIDRFSKSLALWDDLHPEYHRVVNDAISEIRKTSYPIKGRLEHLITPIPEKHISSLPTSEVDWWFQVDRSYPSLDALRKGLMMWDPDLADALSQYRKAAARFNIEVARFNLRIATAPADSGALQKVADEIRPIVKRTIDALDHIEAELVKIV